MGQRPSRPELRLLPLFSRLDRPHVRPRQTHDPVRDPIHLRLIHLPLLAEDLLRNRQIVQDFCLDVRNPSKDRLQLADVSSHILEHSLLRPVDDLLRLPLGLAEPEVILLRLPSPRPHLPAQSSDRLNQPAPDAVEQPHVGRELDLLRKHCRVGQQPPGPDDPPFDQNRVRLLFQVPEKLRPQAFADLGQRARIQRRRGGHGIESAKRLHIRILHDLGDDLTVAELGHVLEQKKPQNKLGVLGWPSDIGKVLEIFIFKLLPGDELSDPRPAVALVKRATEGKEFGKKDLGFTVFGLVHAADLPRKVHAFRGAVCEKRAFRALDRSAMYHITIILSIAYGK